MVTWNAARTLNLGAAYDIAVGNAANFVVLDVTSRFDAIRRRSAPLAVVSRGKVIVERAPAHTLYQSDIIASQLHHQATVI